MTRFLLALMLTGLNGAAWGQSAECPAKYHLSAFCSKADLDCVWSPDTAPNYWCVSGPTEAPASPPRYTLDEIDRMRAAVEKIVSYPNTMFGCPGMTFGTCDGNTQILLFDEQHRQAVENLLQTYMSQGVRPEELEAKVK